MSLAAACGALLFANTRFMRAQIRRETKYHGDTMRVREYEARALVAQLSHCLAEQLENAPAETLTCPRCGFTSYNGNDVLNQYCGFCHVWLQDAASLNMMMMSPAERAMCLRLECTYARLLPDGRALIVESRESKAWLRVHYEGDPHPPMGLDGVWAYESLAFAVSAAATWEPAKEREPYGWLFHYGSGRRRPHGNARQEYTRVQHAW